MNSVVLQADPLFLRNGAYVLSISYILAFVAFLIVSISGLVVAVGMRRRIKKDLGGAAFDRNLTDIGNWMKVDEAEKKVGLGPGREWVPKSKGSGSRMSGAYCVVRPFFATEPISGRRQRFVQGMAIIADLSQDTPDVTIQAGMSYFVVDYLTFSNSCKHETEGGLRGTWG